jgi:cyclopropane-fatty-acyl-phospholipid synthase
MPIPRQRTSNLETDMSGTIAKTAVDAFIARVGANCKPFSIEMPDGQVRTVGSGGPVFHAALRNDRAFKAVRSLDQGNLAEAYMRGDIDLDGDMLQLFAMRATHDDRHFLTGLHQQAGDKISL